MIISIIAARSINHVIGIEGQIPWNIPGEQKQFKNLTTHNAVIMGRKTYESIGHPLKNRINIVVSGKHHYGGKWDSREQTTLITVKSLDEALETVNEMENVEVFIAGGGTLYEQALPVADRLYMTDVDINIPIDLTTVENRTAVFFPEFDEDEFVKTKVEASSSIESIRYTRRTWIRRKSLSKFGPVITGWHDASDKKHSERERVSGFITIDDEKVGNICLSMDPMSENYKTIWWSLNRHNNLPGIKGQSTLYLPEHSFEDVKEIAGILLADQLKIRRQKQVLYMKAIDRISEKYDNI